ncbi:MAG: YdcF family protein [Erysipelotrichaceae bacterium]
MGSPCNRDGSISDIQKERCDVAISYYKSGIINKVIVSGGAIHTPYIEAEQMAQYLSKVIPASIIFKENKAHNTYENIKFTNQMIKENDSILYISSKLHLRRMNYFIKHYSKNYVLVSDHKHCSIKDYLIEFYHQIQTILIEIKLLWKK